MVKRLTNYLIIDWGFTRFKLWFLDENRKIIKDSFFIIKDINKNPEFYTKKELDNIFKIILTFIKELDLEGKDLVILNSCQMHGIAGLFANSEPFFSTWNDLPNQYNKTKVKAINGTPSLISMPNNKLSSENKCLSFFSEFIKNNIRPGPQGFGTFTNLTSGAPSFTPVLIICSNLFRPLIAHSVGPPLLNKILPPAAKLQPYFSKSCKVFFLLSPLM